MKPSLLALVVALAPVIARAQPPDRERGGTVWTDREFGFGAALLGVGYGGQLLWAQQRDGDQDALLVPVLGPWLELLSQPDCTGRDMFCSHDTATRGVLLVTGAAQLVGLGLMAHAFKKSHHRKSRVYLAPSISAEGPGLLVRGRF
jgi:hypothetical protein